MTVEEMVIKAIPIHEKHCYSEDGRKCEKDCRMTIDHKHILRAALTKRIIEYGNEKRSEGFQQAKSGIEISY